MTARSGTVSASCPARDSSSGHAVYAGFTKRAGIAALDGGSSGAACGLGTADRAGELAWTTTVRLRPDKRCSGAHCPAAGRGSERSHGAAAAAAGAGYQGRAADDVNAAPLASTDFHAERQQTGPCSIADQSAKSRRNHSGQTDSVPASASERYEAVRQLQRDGNASVAGPAV